MSQDETNENTSPLVLAGLACLLCMPVVYLVTRPVTWLSSAAWVSWLLTAIFLMAPFTVAFMVLRRCAWHDEWPRSRRLLFTIVSSCMIVGVDLLLTGALAMVAGLVTGLSHKMGGN